MRFQTTICHLLILVLLFSLVNAQAFAKDYITSIFLILNDGSPITTTQDLRFSLWSDARYVDGDIDGAGAINTGSSHFAGYQTEITLTPDSIGRLRIGLHSLPNFPQVTPDNQFLMVEYKDDADPDTAYTIYTASYIDGTELERYPLVENGPDIYKSIVTNFGTTSDTFVLDENNDAADVTLQFGDTLSESLRWNNVQNYFELSDALVVDGNVNLNGTTIRLDWDETGDPDQDIEIIAEQGSETNGVIRFDDGDNRWEIAEQGLQVENTGTGESLRIDDEAGDTTPFVIDDAGLVGVGLETPTFNFHLFDSGSSLATEWIGLDDGTNQVSILSGSQDPKLTATDADVGSLYLNSDNGLFYIKQDDGPSVNWNKIGIEDDIHDALQGTFGLPSALNRFVTDQDPRLQATSGAFGEVALGTRLDYEGSKKLDRSNIYYTRVFFPADTTVSSMGVFTTSVTIGNINMGIYSDNDGPDTKLAETGTQTGVSSLLDDFWEYPLSSPLLITEAGFYWIALAVTSQPFARTYDSAEDVFVPYRLESKANGSTTLPTTPTLNPVGNTADLPYFAAFE